MLSNKVPTVGQVEEAEKSSRHHAKEIGIETPPVLIKDRIPFIPAPLDAAETPAEGLSYDELPEKVKNSKFLMSCLVDSGDLCGPSPDSKGAISVIESLFGGLVADKFRHDPYLTSVLDHCHGTLAL